MKKDATFFCCLWLVSAIVLFLGSTTTSAQEAKRSQGRPVTVSTTEAGDYQASYAVDGNTATRWSSQANSYNQWLDVDLGATYDISQVVIRWADGRYATHLDIQIKVNSVDPFVTIKSMDGNTNATANHIKGLKGNARYVRFNGRGRANGAGYRIAEFEVYGYQTTTPAEQLEINTLTARLKQYHVERTLTGPDYANDVTITAYTNQMNQYGKMTNLTYVHNGTWPEHAKRMRQMAVAYRNPASIHYNSSALRDKIVLGLNYYFVTGPYTHENWYEVKIGGPTNNMSAIILMKGAVDEDTLRTFSSSILDYVGETSHKGKNRAWVAMAPINKGCIEGRHYLVNRGFYSFVNSLGLAPNQGDEGIKADNSVHQHHEQLQTGSYGKELMVDNADYMQIADGTTYMAAFGITEKQRLSNILLKGLQLQSYRDQVDFGNNGRSLSWSSFTGNIKVATLEKMKDNQPDSATAYQNWINHINGGAYPGAYRGATHFWKSDLLSFRGADYYLSAKIISTRTYGTENLNGENLKGYNLPMGATNIMTSGNEYKQIYPVWDWSKIPGTTAEVNDSATLIDSATKYVIGTNAFGGGISHNDEGVMSYDHNYRGVTAKKSYFFMDNMMLCLGKGITAQKSNLVVTSINQTFLSGNITYNRGTTETFSGTALTADDFNWIHHNNVGYIFPVGGYMTMQKASQSGTWKSIRTNGSGANVTHNIFSAWFNHSPTPSNRSYCYIVAPAQSVADMPTAAAGHGFVIVQNTTSIQAIRNDNGSFKRWAVVFHDPGTVNMGNGLTISSDKKIIVFIKEYSGNYRISVSDPLYNQSTVALKINKQVQGGTYANGFTTLNISFNTGDLVGKAKTGFFNKIQSGSSMASNEVQPQLLVQQEKDQTGKHMVIYPNPTEKMINVEGVIDGATIEIYDLSGVRLISTKKKQIDVGHLKRGSYVIKIDEGGKITSRVFIKE